MRFFKAQVAARVNVRAVTQFLSIASIATLLPFYIHLQWATGPIVNALLIIALFLVGIRSALVLCLIPSLMALAGGLVPSILAPVIPFIMISNALFVVLVDYFYRSFKDSDKGYWAGLVIGASIKFLFLYFSINAISKLIIKQELIIKVAQLFSWPQLATALSGGMIAWIFLKKIKRI